MTTSPGPATTRSGGAAGRPVLGGASAATDALAGAGSERVWALTDGEVAEAVRALGALAVAVDAHLVTVLAEAKRRSLGAGDGWGPVDWARAMAPGLSTRDLADLDIVAGVAAGGEPRLADVLSAVADGADGADGAVAGPQAQQALPVGKAAQLVRFHRSVAGLADPAQLDEVTAVLLDAARGPGALDERHLAAAIRHTGTLLRPDRLVEHDTALRRAHRSLVKGRGPVGLARYTVLLDEEGAAILDTAVDALAKPVPDEAGERDPRTPAARRADALLDLVTRAVAAPDGVARQAKTTLVVTMDLAALQQRCRGAGRTPTGEVLTPATVRRLACDCQVVPMVLGTHGEILDQGRAPPPLRPGPGPPPVGAGPTLHLPRLQQTSGLDRCPPPHPLGRPWPHHDRQRRPAVSGPPHGRPPARLCRPCGPRPRPGPGRLGPLPRFVRHGAFAAAGSTHPGPAERRPPRATAPLTARRSRPPWVRPQPADLRAAPRLAGVSILEVPIRDESIRLGQLLKLAGVVDDGATARAAIELGEVRVDGEVCARRGSQVRPGQTVEYAGQSLRVVTGG